MSVMRAPLIVVLLGTLTGAFVACVDETVPDDLVLDDQPAVTEGRDAGKAREAGKGTTPGKTTPPAGGTDPGPGTGSTDAGTPKDPAPPTTPPTPTTKPTATAPPAPTTPPTAFKRIDIRFLVDTGDYILQCTLDAKTQLVWKSDPSGTDANARFATPQYGQQPNVQAGCGSKVNGVYPLVFSSMADGAMPAGTYVVKCTSSTRGDVFRVTGALQGHPLATYAYDEPHPACAGQ